MSVSSFDPRATPTGAYRPGRIRDENLNTIMSAAAEEFVQHGYRGASIQRIADRAGLPKANVHYYFPRKTHLYQSVLKEIVALWNSELDELQVDDDPAQALARFIRSKVRLSFLHPTASKLFALEIISGAPNLQAYLSGELREWVAARAGVVQAWIDAGRMRPVDPLQLIVSIWATTQHYADFDEQVLTLMGKRRYDAAAMEQIADFLTDLILTGCGLEPPVS